MPTNGDTIVSIQQPGIETRLEEVCRLLGGRGKAAALAGVTPQMLRRYVLGESRPGFDVVAKLADASGVSLDWLATGKGAMRLAEHGATAATDNQGVGVQSGQKERAATVSDLVEEGTRRFLAKQDTMTGKGAGGLTHEQLTEQAALVVGKFCEAHDLKRNPEREALLIALLVSRFEFEGYSQETADRLLKLAV